MKVTGDRCRVTNVKQGSLVVHDKRPKPECRSPKEIRNPKLESERHSARINIVRISGFELLSVFGIRISDFKPNGITARLGAAFV
jgi:hypothetical protein